MRRPSSCTSSRPAVSTVRPRSTWASATLGRHCNLQGPAGPQGRLQGFVGPLGLMDAAVDGLAQADLGLRLRHAEGDRRGRGRGQRSAGAPPSAHVPQLQPHFQLQLVGALAGNLQHQERCVHGRCRACRPSCVGTWPARGAARDDLQAGRLAVQVGPGQHAAAQARGTDT